MASGQVDCVLGDYAVVALNAALGQNKVVATYSPEYFGIAVRIGETSLLNKLNDILNGLLGTNLDTPTYNANYTAMYEKWFNIEPPSTTASSNAPGFEYFGIFAIAAIPVIRKAQKKIKKS